jgi:glycosyltransferase involved in cell wall biosynthesis
MPGPTNLKSKLNILQLCSSSAISGAERHVHALSTMLKDRGHSVHAVTTPGGWLPRTLTEFDVPTNTMVMKGAGWWRTIGFLIKHIRANKVDALHTHLTRAAYIGHMVGLMTRVPVITSVHIANNDNIYRKLARGQNRLVAVSDFVRGMLHGRGVPDRYIDTVFNGTDLLDIAYSDPWITRQEIGLAREMKVVGMIGRVCREKGHLEMIKAMTTFGVTHPSAHLLFVGRIEAEFEIEMRQLLRNTGLENRVTTIGERNDIPALIDCMTMTAMPSYMETFGVAAVEAMARGKAVVATRVGGLPEVVQHRHTGLLVDLEPEDISDAVSYLLSNDDIREEMGVRARQVVEEKFTLYEMVSRFETVYRKASLR